MVFGSDMGSTNPADLNALLQGVSAFSSAVSLVFGLICLISLWKLFTKAGEKGWKAIIPVYNLYILFKLCWKTKKFWANILTLLFGTIATSAGAAMIVLSANEAGELTNPVLGLVGLGVIVASTVLLIIALVITIKLYVRMSKAYGQEGAFAIGLVFLPFIFLPVLAFGKSEYIGPQD